MAAVMPIKRFQMSELAVVNKGADWCRLKSLVLDSVASPITKRVYNLGLDSSSPGTARSRDPTSPGNCGRLLRMLKTS
jgi:hypothetical protein